MVALVLNFERSVAKLEMFYLYSCLQTGLVYPSHGQCQRCCEKYDRRTYRPGKAVYDARGTIGDNDGLTLRQHPAP